MQPVSAGGLAPKGADMNGILNWITTFMVWSNGGGQFPFSSTFATSPGYKAGAVVQLNSGLGSVVNLVDGNTVDPNVALTNWAPWAGASMVSSVKGNSWYLVDIGAVNAIALTIAGVSVYNGLTVFFKPAVTNTIPGVTVNLNGGGALPLVNSKGGALIANDLTAGGIYGAAYDSGSSKWWLVVPVTSQTAGAVFSNTTALSPAAVVSTTGLMAGMGSTIAVTPTKSGRLYVHVSGMMQNSNANQTVVAQLRYGTGAAPAASAALTGTVVSGGLAQYPALSTVANAQVPFGFGVIIPGLAVGTAYWLDLSLSNSGGSGSAFVTGVTFSIIEI
jgi:hypothetical protein